MEGDAFGAPANAIKAPQLRQVHGAVGEQICRVRIGYFAVDGELLADVHDWAALREALANRSIDASAANGADTRN